MKDSKKAAVILAACEALDPQHQGMQWPDPIVWDGRPLEEQAADLYRLLLAKEEAGEDVAAAIAAIEAAFPDLVV